MNTFARLESLKRNATKLGVSNIANIVLNNPLFHICSGSAHENCHHYGDGGLVQHTSEVWDIAYNISKLYASGVRAGVTPPKVIVPDDTQLFLACLFHDVGKMWDYEKIGGEWVGTTHKRHIHHISRSAIEWSRAVEKTGVCRDIEDEVLHAILAHHGQRQFGSPVAPKSRLAWLLHFSDGISARMNDADTLDIIGVRK